MFIIIIVPFPTILIILLAKILLFQNYSITKFKVYYSQNYAGILASSLPEINNLYQTQAGHLYSSYSLSHTHTHVRMHAHTHTHTHTHTTHIHYSNIHDLDGFTNTLDQSTDTAVPMADNKHRLSLWTQKGKLS